VVRKRRYRNEDENKEKRREEGKDKTCRVQEEKIQDVNSVTSIYM